MIFKTFQEFCQLKEMAANRSVSHLLDAAHSDRLIVIISSFRGGVDQPPPRSMADLERDIRSQRGYEIISNPACLQDQDAPPEIEGPNPVAELPKTGKMGITKSRGGFKEKIKDAFGHDVLGPDGEPLKQDVCEDSLVVSHKRGKGHPSDAEVLDFFKGLCRKYNQEAFLFKSPSSDEFMMVYPNGSMDNLVVQRYFDLTVERLLRFRLRRGFFRVRACGFFFCRDVRAARLRAWW